MLLELCNFNKLQEYTFKHKNMSSGILIFLNTSGISQDNIGFIPLYAGTLKEKERENP